MKSQRPSVPPDLLIPNPQSLIPILLLILDGLADRPQTVLGGKTPLEAAWTPHLDRLAEVGTNGLLVPFAPGVPLESEFAHFLLFGYPAEQFPGRAAFEAIDSILGPLVTRVEKAQNVLVVVTGDHATPSSGPLIHSGEAVPIVIAGGANVLSDHVKAFNERAAITGGMGRIQGTELMPLLLNFTDRVRLHGVGHQRQARPYWSRRTEPFIVMRKE